MSKSAGNHREIHSAASCLSATKAANGFSVHAESGLHDLAKTLSRRETHRSSMGRSSCGSVEQEIPGLRVSSTGRTRLVEDACASTGALDCGLRAKGRLLLSARAGALAGRIGPRL